MLNKPGNLSCRPWKSVCHVWRVTDATGNYARLWYYQSSYRKLVELCVWILFMCYHQLKVSCVVVFRDEGAFEPTTEMLSMETKTNFLTWDVMWIYLLDNVFWSNVTEHIYIRSFGILLMERHTAIEHGLGPAVFWDWTQHTMLIPIWHFGITSLSHLQGSRCLSSRQPAHTGCLLEQLNVTELV